MASSIELRCENEALYWKEADLFIGQSARVSWPYNGPRTLQMSRRLTEDEQWHMASVWVSRQDKKSLQGRRKIFRRFRNSRWCPSYLR